MLEVDEERIRRLENELAETGDPVVEASLRSARTEATRLREALSSATPLEDEPHDPTVVELGDAVTAREDGSNELERSTVVGKLEARLDLTWISVKSPLGLGAAGQQTGSDRRRRDAGWADAVRGAEDRARQPIRISIPVSAHDDAEPLVLGQVVEENSPNLAYSPSLRRSASFSLCPARLSSDDWVMPFVEDRFGSNPFTGVSPSVCVVIRLANRNP